MVGCSEGACGLGHADCKLGIVIFDGAPNRVVGLDGFCAVVLDSLSAWSHFACVGFCHGHFDGCSTDIDFG